MARTQLLSHSHSQEELSNRLMSLSYLGQDDQYVIGLTYPQSLFTGGGAVWRSSSYGSAGTWTDLSSAFEDALVALQGGEKGNVVFTGISNFQASEAMPAKIFFQGVGNFNWMTDDYGKTLKALKGPPGGINADAKFKLHPKVSDWMLAVVPRHACLYGYDSELCVKDLSVSYDFGQNWKNLTQASHGRIKAFWDAAWAADVHGDRNDHDYVKESIVATVYEDVKHLHGISEWDDT